MKPQNRSLQRIILTVLAAIAPGALHAEIVLNPIPSRSITSSISVFSHSDTYNPGDQSVTSSDEGDFKNSLDRASSLTWAQVKTTLSQASTITHTNDTLLVFGEMSLTMSLTTEVDNTGAPDSGSGSGAEVSLGASVLVRVSVNQPYGYLLKASTDHGQPLGNTAAVNLYGSGLAPIVFGYTPNTAEAPASGTQSGILPMGSYVFTVNLSDVASVRAGHPDYSNASSALFSLAIKPLTHLPDFGPFTNSTATPARSSNPWKFSAQFPSTAEGLQLQVQSTLTTNDPASWAPLPGDSIMAGTSPNWTLDTRTVPTGDRYFRVVASAPFTYSNVVSTTVGPISVLQGFEPFGDFVVRPWAANAGDIWPFGTWLFQVHVPAEMSAVDGVRVHFQWSASADAPPSGWSDFGAHVSFADEVAELDTTNPPLGTVFFRAVASAPTFGDVYSVVRGPYTIEPPQPIMPQAFNASATVLLSDLLKAQASGSALSLQLASNCPTVTFDTTPGTQTTSASPLTISVSETCAHAILAIVPTATVTTPSLAAGNGVAVLDQGIIKGPVYLIGQDGSGLITYNAIVAQGGGNIVAQGGGNIVGHDGGSIVGHDGGSLVQPTGAGLASVDSNSAEGNRVTPAGFAPKKVALLTAGPAQPAFTGLMRIDGDYSQFAGSLIIGIAGTNTTAQGAQQYDQLVVTGQANLFGGRIAFGLFNPDNQTNQFGLFQPPDGASFDVIVASNIVVTSNIRFTGPIWGDGQFFTGSVVTRPDGLQAVRLVATHVHPRLFLQSTVAGFQLAYATNYTGYAIQSSPTLSSTNWTTLSTSANPFVLSPTNTSGFFRLSKP